MAVSTVSRGKAAIAGASPSRRSRTVASRLLSWTAFASAIAAVCLLLMIVPLATVWLLADSLAGRQMGRSEDRIARTIYFGSVSHTTGFRVANLSPSHPKDMDRLPASAVEEAPPPSAVVASASPAVAVEAAPSPAGQAVPAVPAVSSPRPKPAAAAKNDRPRLASVAPTTVPPAVRDPRSVEKLFDKVIRPEPKNAGDRDDDVVGSVTAYANPELPRGDDHRTAVYDIAGHTVHLPNGERLEAHSGLGANYDNPASYRLRMRGVTPPNVYRLSMRERLFHGVAAIRLTPLDPAAMNGRDGMLAHTYMLGPRGESNGCVSFRDYSKFLAAFRRGEITRMIVVSRMTGSPANVIAAHRTPGGRYAAERDKISER
jgi:hypothetical protein